MRDIPVIVAVHNTDCEQPIKRAVIDSIEQKVKQATPYVNPAKAFVELERDRVSDLYKRKRSK